MRDWQGVSADKRKALNMEHRDSYNPWTDKHPVCASLHNDPRSLEVLNVAAWAHTLQVPESIDFECSNFKGFYANVSQNIEREPWGWDIGCITQNSTLFSFEKNILLSGFDNLRLQGHPNGPATAPARKFGNCQCRQLAGEGFFLPHVATIMAAYVNNPFADWWKQ